MRLLLLAISSILVLSSCSSLMGEEIARLSFKETSNEKLNIEETTLSLKKGDEIKLWSDVDIEFEDALALQYTIEIFIDTTSKGGFRLDALETNPTLMEVKTQVGDSYKWSFNGKMKSIVIEDDADYTFKAVLNSSENPSLLLKKADLVFKK
jgi:hypothetical protein